MDQFILRKPISPNNRTFRGSIPTYYKCDLHFFGIYSASTIIWVFRDLCLPFGVCLLTVVVKGENYCNVMRACVLFLHIEARL